MTIIGLQRRLVEVGRIRMGEKNEKGHPTRLDSWKLTSRDQLRLTAAAKAFGGEVREWKDHPGQYELHTEVDSLPILLMPGQALSQHYELWSGGGCKRRCDGETEQLTDGACLCNPENRECKPHTRLNVLLPDVAGIGAWRLDTQGYYAATELSGTVDLLEVATMRGVLLPARLRIDQRVVLRDGQTKRFPVPTLDIDVRPLEMHAITQAAAEGEVVDVQSGLGVLPKGYRPVAELPSGGVSVADGLAGAAAQAKPPEKQSARAAAPMGEVGDFASEGDIPIDDEHKLEPPEEEAVALLSREQQTMLMALATELKIGQSDRYAITERITGDNSIRKVPKDKVDELKNAFVAFADSSTQTDDQLIGQLRAYGDTLGIRQQVDAALSQHRGERDWLERQVARLKERFDESRDEAARKHEAAS